MRHLTIGCVSLLICLVTSGCSPSLHDCIARGNLEKVKILLEKDPSLVYSLDGKKKTPLHSAVTYKQMEAMELLVQKGADVQARDVTGMTPLHIAAMLGRSEETKWLLEHDADPAITDDYGDMPIHTAAVFGRGQIISLLINNGIAYDIPNRNGQNPEDIAREYRQERVVNYLEKLRDKRS